MLSLVLGASVAIVKSVDGNSGVAEEELALVGRRLLGMIACNACTPAPVMRLVRRAGKRGAVVRAGMTVGAVKGVGRVGDGRRVAAFCVLGTCTGGEEEFEDEITVEVVVSVGGIVVVSVLVLDERLLMASRRMARRVRALVDGIHGEVDEDADGVGVATLFCDVDDEELSLASRVIRRSVRASTGSGELPDSCAEADIEDFEPRPAPVKTLL